MYKNMYENCVRRYMCAHEKILKSKFPHKDENVPGMCFHALPGCMG